MVFQSYALYPHMTVRENLEFGLKIRKTPKAEMNRLVNEAAQILGITEFLDRKPKQLSGGQRQRVALGRAIVRKPAVFLFDEPLSNLDAKLRVQMRAEISTPAEAPPDDHRLRHPRPDRGDDDGRPHRGDEQGGAPAGGHAAGGLRAAGQPVRGELHRHAADELPPGDPRRRRRDASPPPASRCRCREPFRAAAAGQRRDEGGARPPAGEHPRGRPRRRGRHPCRSPPRWSSSSRWGTR